MHPRKICLSKPFGSRHKEQGRHCYGKNTSLHEQLFLGLQVGNLGSLSGYETSQLGLVARKFGHARLRSGSSNLPGFLQSFPTLTWKRRFMKNCSMWCITNYHQVRNHIMLNENRNQQTNQRKWNQSMLWPQGCSKRHWRRLPGPKNTERHRVVFSTKWSRSRIPGRSCLMISKEKWQERTTSCPMGIVAEVYPRGAAANS